MSKHSDDLCPRPSYVPPLSTRPHSPPIYLSSVYECHDPGQAADLLAGNAAGYVYARDGHPNADLLAEKCRALHGSEQAAITSSGMAAMALSLVSQLSAGDHLIVGTQLYGRSQTLLVDEARRFGISSSVVDTFSMEAVASALTEPTRLVVVETITNPTLRVSNIAALAELAHKAGARLLVDNTLAGPTICQPIIEGADFVLESLTKMMNGHSDVVLGLLCGPSDAWARVPATLSTWGLASSPLDCWLALRGLGTLSLRMERAASNALAVAQHLVTGHAPLDAVYYSGLPSHPDHELASRQFGGTFGSMVTFTLAGGAAAAEQFIAGARQIPFCPSLGELSTTLSHPASTSHRALSGEARAALGIYDGTIRLSVGIESPDFVLQAVDEGLGSLG